MQKGHFEAIARSVRRTRDAMHRDNIDGNPAALDYVVLSLADELAQFNPLFNKARFIEACERSEEEEETKR